MSRHHGHAALRLSLPVALLLLVLAALIFGVYEWRKTAVPERPLLATKFEHSDHGATQCADCHHNWVDDTGSGPCYNCHKTDPSVSYEMEPLFHEFCWGCHIEKRHDQEVEEGGPVRECALCHPDA